MSSPAERHEARQEATRRGAENLRDLCKEADSLTAQWTQAQALLEIGLSLIRLEAIQSDLLFLKETEGG